MADDSSQHVRVPGFDPALSGFQFPNSFPPRPRTEIPLPGVGSVGIDESGDLAAGMTFTVADLFFAGLRPPPDPSPPVGGDRYEYLVRRQADSLELGRGLLGFYKLMSARPADQLKRTVTEEWPKVRATLDGGRLAQLGLVRARSRNPADLGQNHQVVAFGYDFDGPVVRLAIYDPNTPGREATLAFSVDTAVGDSPPSYSADDRPVYSFFELAYTPRDPTPFREATDAQPADEAVGNAPPVSSSTDDGTTKGKATPRRRSTERLDVTTNIASDQATTEDLLGYRSIVEALERLVVDPRTSYPLTVAVSAPWGAGKSSVMLQLRQRLLRRKTWTVVTFNAWRYEAGEQLWAALAKAMYDAASQGDWWHRVKFRTRLELRRMPPIRTAARLVVPIVSAIVGFAFAQLLVHSTDPGVAGTPLGQLLSVIAPVLALVGSAQVQWGDIVDPFKHAIDDYAKGPEAGDGFTKDASANVTALLDLLLEDEKGIAIFVDDLDRCGPRNLVRMVEAVSQVFASTEVEDVGAAKEATHQSRKLVFVLGMDRRMVARSIEVEYRDVIQRLREMNDPAAMSFGADFLDKIVQLWVTLPPPGETALEAVLRRAAGMRQQEEARPTQTEVAAATEDVLQAANQAPGGALESIATSAAELSAAEDDPGRQAALEAARQRLLQDALQRSEAVWPIFTAGLEHLERNPRQVTRYHNALRLQLYLATTTSTIQFRPEQLNAMARWVAIRMRWPALADAMDTDTQLLAALERTVNPRLRIAGPEMATDGADGRAMWLNPAIFPERQALEDALKISRAAQSISRLPFEAFLRVS